MNSISWIAAGCLCAACLMGVKPAFAEPEPLVLTNPFFAMDTGTKDADHRTPESQAQLLKELGYAGIGYSGFEGIPGMLKALDACGLKMFTVYSSAKIGPEGSTFDTLLREGVAALHGRDTILWLTISSDFHKPSSPEGDVQASMIVNAVADIAEESNLRVALYPHTGLWLETIEDALRVARKVNRKNVGVTFNLCHWLNAGKGLNLESLLRQSKPYLYVVTINGADTEGGWDRLIQPLDKGSFDVRGVLAILKDMDYQGPIGLQGYGIKGDIRDNLKRSMAVWREWTEKKP